MLKSQKHIMKNLFHFLIIFLFIISCGQYEKIGSYKYRVKTYIVFTGDYHGIYKTIKTYSYRKKHQAGVVISSKLSFNTPADTIYTYGFSQIDSINKQLIGKEYYYNGYAKYLETDSIVKVFQQLTNGNLILKKYTSYYNGQASEKFIQIQ